VAYFLGHPVDIIQVAPKSKPLTNHQQSILNRSKANQ